MKSKAAAAVTTVLLASGGMLAGGTAVAQPDQPQAETPCEPSAKACVSLSTKQAWLQTDGHVDYGPVPITSGKPGPETATPPGTFTVQWKDADHRSGEDENNGPMPNSVFFTNTGVAFHEGSLQRESDGCIHLSQTAAKTFFDSLEPSDVVQVVP